MSQEKDETEIRRLDNAWNEAYLCRERSSLAEIAADDFSGLMPFELLYAATGRGNLRCSVLGSNGILQSPRADAFRVPGLIDAGEKDQAAGARVIHRG